MRLTLLSSTQCLLVGIIALCTLVTFFTLINQQLSTSNKPYRDYRYYEQLIAQTRLMVQEYKRLSGRNSLPANLVLEPAVTSNEANPPSLPPIASSTKVEVETDTKNSPVHTSLATNDGEGSSPRDLVMGIAHEVDPKNLAVFIKSLREVSTAALILFVNSPTSDLIDQITRENRVKVIRYEVNKLPERVRSYHPSTLRWYLFRDFFIERDGYKLIYNRVWLLDVRDTYFQRDPFTIFSTDTPTLNVFGGVESRTIRQCGWNSGWIRDCFGERTVTAIGNGKIICSGVTGGTMDEIAQYIDIMGGIVLGEDSYHTIHGKALVNNFPTCERNGVDQGVHNVLVHMKLLSNLKEYGQRSGPVANLQAKIATVEADKVYNGDHNLVHIVHQYDRYPDLQKHLFLKYVDWINVADFAGEWSATPECAKYTYRENVDSFRGKCDLAAKGGATSAVTCCKHCNAATGCQAFTFSGGMCYLKNCRNEGAAATLKDAVSAFRND